MGQEVRGQVHMDTTMEDAPVDQIGITNIVHELLEDDAGLRLDPIHDALEIGSGERPRGTAPLRLEETTVEPLAKSVFGRVFA